MDYREKIAFDELDENIKKLESLKKSVERGLQHLEPYMPEEVMDTKFFIIEHLEKAQKLLVELRGV